MSAALRKQVSDPTVKATVAAHAATDAILGAISQQMMRIGFADGLDVDQDRELRRLLWLKVLARINQRRDPRLGVVAAAIGRAPEPTRAAAMVASGLLDVAVGIEYLSKTLADAVVNELNGFCHASVVRGAIRRGLVDLFNAQARGDE